MNIQDEKEYSDKIKTLSDEEIDNEINSLKNEIDTIILQNPSPKYPSDAETQLYNGRMKSILTIPCQKWWICCRIILERVAFPASILFDKSENSE